MAVVLEQQRGYNILVKGVTPEELERFVAWMDAQSWDIGEPVLFPSKDPSKATVYLDSSNYSGTWRNSILPALEEYWGADRIMYDGDFVETSEE